MEFFRAIPSWGVVVAASVALFCGIGDEAGAAPIRARLDEVWVKPLPQAKRQFLLLHEERGVWWLETVNQTGTHLSLLLTRKVFKNLNEARSFLEDQKRDGFRLMPEAEVRALDIPTTEVPGESLWKVHEQWNWEWEKRYAEWIEKNLDAEFFNRHGIQIDCADVPIALRWIFAREMGLPMANRLAGFGLMFSQDSVREFWMAHKTGGPWYKDERFLDALDYLLGATDTRTLYLDGYPIAIRPESLTPGAHHLEFHGESGHVMVVRHMDLADASPLPLQMAASTVPRTIRDLMLHGFWDRGQPNVLSGGFMRLRWPIFRNGEWVLEEPEKHPYFSKEQYQPEWMGGFTIFAEAVLNHLNPRFDSRARLKEGVRWLNEQLRIRDETVRKGFAFCSKEDCAESGPNYFNWSTPSRDKRIHDLIFQLQTMVKALSEDKPEMLEAWKTVRQTPALEVEGKTYTAGQVIHAWKTEAYSSDPRAPIAKRWGLSPKAATERWVEQVSQLVSERAGRITRQAGACKRAGSCEPSRPGWFEWNTFETDEKLRTLARAAGEYCEYSPAEDCEEYRRLLQTVPVTAAARTLPIKAWLDLSVWMVSDPRASLALRWAEHRTKFWSAAIARPGEVRIDASGFATVNGGGRTPAMDLLRGAVSAEANRFKPAEEQKLAWPLVTRDGVYSVAIETVKDQSRVTARRANDKRGGPARQDLGSLLMGYERLPDGEYFETLDDEGQRKVFRYRKARWVPLQLQKDEARIAESFGGFVVTDLKKGGQRLRPFAGGKTVYQSKVDRILIPREQVLGPGLRYFLVFYTGYEKTAALYSVADPRQPILTGSFAVPSRTRFPSAGKPVEIGTGVERGVAVELEDHERVWVEQKSALK